MCFDKVYSVLQNVSDMCRLSYYSKTMTYVYTNVSYWMYTVSQTIHSRGMKEFGIENDEPSEHDEHAE